MHLRDFLNNTPKVCFGRLVQKLTYPAIASFIGFIGTSQPGQALTFNFKYAENTPQHTITAFEEAGSIWAGHLQDNITLNIDVGYEELPNGMLGGARPEMIRINWADAIQQFGLDKTSWDDTAAFLSLSTFEKLYRGNGHSSLEFNGSSSLWLTRANAKALGILTGDESAFDGEIRLSDSAKWDFDPSDGIVLDQYDFIGTALHEIGHILGVVSGIDILDLYEQDQSPDSGNLAIGSNYLTSMDLFRHSDATKYTRNRDWTLDDRVKHFSLTGIIKMAEFSSGLSAGGSAGGYQASHWKEGTDGIMQPSLKAGERNSISWIDLKLMDALGWDLNSGSQVDYLGSSVSFIAYDDSFDGLLSRTRSSSGNTTFRYWQNSLASWAEDGSAAQSVPEPRSMLAFLGLGVIGAFTSIFKSVKPMS